MRKTALGADHGVGFREHSPKCRLMDCWRAIFLKTRFGLEHDAKKWEPVFRKIMRPNKNLTQNADSDFLHFALARI
jgi:hypothetical protein